MNAHDDLPPALLSFAVSFTPHQHVLVAGDDRFADAIRATGIPRLVSVAPDVHPLKQLFASRTASDEPPVDVMLLTRSISERAACRLVQRFKPRRTVLLGEAARFAHEVLAAAEEFTIVDARIQPRRNTQEPLIAATEPAAPRLHLACGPEALPGWVNIDNKPYPGVDRLWDLRDGLPFRDAQYIFAEHFVEHIEYADAGALFTECRRALHPEGVLRISTPNLDWVWAVSYHPDRWSSEADAIRECLVANRAFRGWGHRFLYNWSTLREQLLAAGFGSVTRCAYGESTHPALRGIERHEQYPDTPDLPHVLVAEASGMGAHVAEDATTQAVAEYLRDIHVS